MVRRQLCTLDDLMDSGFGRPFPRHGLQLLFWFANCSVTCELINFVLFIKLVSECQPENGSFGFHHFNNNEKFLPVLYKTRKLKPETQVVYSEVGNLNTNAFPAAANLPAYVRENYEITGNNENKNTDRIIISFHMQTRIVETVHVTKHEEGFSGRFSPHATYKVSCELIHALQNPELDITTFLTHMGYYTDIQSQQLYNGMVPLTTNYYHQPMQHYSEGHDIWRSLALDRSNWRQLFKDLDGGAEPRYCASGGAGGGGDSIFKVFLTAGALYLAAKCFSWLWSCWAGRSHENIIKMVGWSTPRYQPSHVMLDYVY